MSPIFGIVMLLVLIWPMVITFRRIMYEIGKIPGVILGAGYATKGCWRVMSMINPSDNT
jgi:hypothetical protein